MKQRHVHLDAVEITVLDEADHMADLGFLPGVTRIMAATPERGQRMLFSATLDNGVDNRCGASSATRSHTRSTRRRQPRRRDDSPRLPRERRRRQARDGPGPRLRHGPPHPVHAHQAPGQEACQAAQPARHPGGRPARQPLAGRSATATSRRSARARSACSSRPTSPRAASTSTTSNSWSTSTRPTEHKAYLHRSGRTARAGSAGDVVTVVLPEQRRETTTLLRKAAITATPQRVNARSPEVGALIGERAAHVPYVAPAVRPSGGGKPRRAPGGNSRGARHGAPAAHRARQGGGRTRSAADFSRSASGGRGGR